MPFDFPDKLRSTRTDKKILSPGTLIDASNIAGKLALNQLPDGVGTGTDQVWRPFFFVLGGVGPGARQYITCRLAPLNGGGRVSRGTYDVAGNLAPRLILDVARYRNNGSYYGDGNTQSEDSSSSRFVVSLTLTPPEQLTSTQKLFVFWAKTPAVLPTSGSDPNYDVIGPVEVTGAGGYTATPASSSSGITVEDEGTALSGEATTLNFEGAGVEVTGTGSEKTVTISGSSSSSGITQGQADNRYLRKSGGTLTGKLTLSGAPTNNLHAATKKYVDDNVGSGSSSEGNDSVIDPVEPLDGSGLSEGDVVISDHKFYQYTDPSTANAFKGVLGVYREAQTYYYLTSRSDSHFGAHGRFTDNHDDSIGAVLVGEGNNNIMEVHIDKTIYEAAKGSAVASSDDISASFTGTISGSSVTLAHTLSYERSFTVGSKTWLSFEGQAPNSVPKRVGTAEGGWSLIVSQNSSVLLTHAVGAEHFREYIPEGHDSGARNNIDTLQNTEDELKHDLAKLHTYIAEHVTDISDQVMDPTQADSPAHYYLTQKARYETGGQSIPFESGLYELTTGTANKTKIKLAKVGSNFWGYVTRGFGGHADAGEMLHNPLSAIAAFFVEYDGTNYYAHAYMKNNVYNYLDSQVNLANTAVFFKMTDGTTALQFEMGILAQQVVGGINYMHLRQHLLSSSTTTATPAQFLAYFTAGNSNAPTLDIGYNPSFSSAGRADYHLRYGNTNTTKAYTFRDSGFAVVTGYLDDVVESTSIRNIVPITETAYNALSVKDPNTYYIRTGA